MSHGPGRRAFRGALACLAALCLAPSAASSAETATSPGAGIRLAVFPVDNLTGVPAPLKGLRAGIVAALAARGLPLMREQTLEAFMARHRVRWVGGVDTGLGRALFEETGANAVLLTSLDVYGEGDTPRIGFSMRLVRIEAEGVRVAWGTGPSLAGNERPGFLGLGLVGDVSVLAHRAVEDATGQLLSFLDRDLSRSSRPSPRAQRRFRPRVFHAAPDTSPAGGIRVAVLPFANESTRGRAGEILAARFVAAFAGAGFTDVVEPGDVRKVLIETRLIQQDGLAYAQAELLRDLLGVDLVVTGTVIQFVEPAGYEGAPVVEFTLTAIDARRRQNGWVAYSRATGNTGVRFFGLGSIGTAGRLSDELIRGVIREAVR